MTTLPGVLYVYVWYLFKHIMHRDTLGIGKLGSWLGQQICRKLGCALPHESAAVWTNYVHPDSY